MSTQIGDYLHVRLVVGTGKVNSDWFFSCMMTCSGRNTDGMRDSNCCQLARARLIFVARKLHFFFLPSSITGCNCKFSNTIGTNLLPCSWCPVSTHVIVWWVGLLVSSSPPVSWGPVQDGGCYSRERPTSPWSACFYYGPLAIEWAAWRWPDIFFSCLGLGRQRMADERDN